MKKLPLIGFCFVTVLGVWMVTSMQGKGGSRNVMFNPGGALLSGLQKTAFALELADCRCCHGSVVDRHHLLAERSVRQCMDCHDILFNETLQSYEAQVVRDCLSAGCHLSDTALKDRHHITVEQGEQQCSNCHEVGFDDLTQSYYVDLLRPCDAAVLATSVSHYEEHKQAAPSSCNSCHMCDLFDVHNEQCVLCHTSTDPVVQAAIQNQDTGCAVCHTESAHSLQCRICHGSSRTYRSDEKPQVHRMHVDRASCGVCHAIPVMTRLEPTGQYCAVCHGAPKKYSLKQLPVIHRRHVLARKYFPFACYMCHGRSLPQLQPTQCDPCHDNKTFDREKLPQIHSAHNRLFDCSNCHAKPWMFEISQTSDCLRCHGSRTYETVFLVHLQHAGRQCWSCHSSKEVSARAGKGCEHCHGAPQTYASSIPVHEEHTDEGMQCWVCHAKVVPIYLNTCLPCDSNLEGIVKDASGNPIGGVTVLTNPGGYSAMTAADGSYTLCVASETLYSVTAYSSGYQNQSNEIRLTAIQTAYLDFTLNVLPPGVTDSDGDGLPDDAEKRIGTDPTRADTDGDGLTDYTEVDYDGDPSDYRPGADLDPLEIDSDGDGFVDGYGGRISVIRYPAGIDLDGDGYVDGEMVVGTNPLSTASHYGDGDLNEDGMTNIGDILLAHRIASGMITPSASAFVHANTAPSGTSKDTIDLADVFMIYRKAMQ